MPDAEVKQFQKEIASRMRMIYPEVEVVDEWRSFRMGRSIYSPELDIAVGPFAIETNYADRYREMLHKSRRFVNSLLRAHCENVGETMNHDRLNRLSYENENPRCFLAIEIENTTTMKHLMGSMVNAGALGKIGIAVAWNTPKLKAFLRVRQYLRFLTEHRKNSFNAGNLLILSRAQLKNAVDKRVAALASH